MSAPDLWDEIDAYEAERDAGRSPEIGPSDAAVLVPGRGCRRKLAYRVQGYSHSDPVPDKVRRGAALGHAVHEYVVAARKRWLPGTPVPYWSHLEKPVPLAGFRREVTPDAYSFAGMHVDDVKSVSDRIYQAVIELGRARDDHAMQVDLYALALTLNRFPVRTCSVTYVNRNDGATFVDSWTWDPAAAATTYEALLQVIRQTAIMNPQDFGRAARSPELAPCDACPFRSRCWGVDLAGVVDETPAMAPEAIQANARAYQNAREELHGWQALSDSLRDRLMACAGQRFVDESGAERVIRVTGGRPPGDGGALDQRRARELLERWGEEPPTLGTAPRLSFPAWVAKLP